MSDILSALSGSPFASQAWRLQNIYAIKPKSGPVCKFKPNEAQRMYYNRMWYCNHILKARQMGFSTLISIDNLDALLFRPGTIAGIIDNTEDDAKKKLQIVKRAYEYLDDPKVHPDTWKFGAWLKKQVAMKASASEIKFSNGSEIYCGVSLRGGTLQRLHVSELGKTAAFSPAKAAEINSGALNTIEPGQIINIESTHEGGRTGLHYQKLRAAMKRVGQELTEIDFQFHFYPWFLMREYKLDYPHIKVRPEIVRYFDELSRELGRTFTHGQMLWYDRKQEQQGFAMLKEFPSTPGEAYQAIVEGAIYGTQIAALRARGGVAEWPLDPFAPLYTAWDIGSSDHTAIWLVQMTAAGPLFVDHYQANMQYAAHYADVVRGWEAQYGRKVASHLLPHDAAAVIRGTVQNYTALLEECGLRNLTVVPRTRDKWLTIGNMRALLPQCRFHARLDVEEEDMNGEVKMTPLAMLEAYRTKETAAGGEIREAPLHDETSHTADAAGYFADAWKLGLLNVHTEGRVKPAATRRW
ncbi:hypothetical protein [Akkermansia glycaniphila]|uniref:Terminase n=1 Tax=Akkermansia glycaniphila TaxID=1679444 RepID=A0A1C7P9F1_9BACT|nr:hypothetical protein [Akkermansia glycaniphila]OCA02190.1 hypothetical protein AC781_11565 [Akkermansia glycaniphila]SEH99365.1 Hypothetical protein PYTT_2385 [Akkermansia glycaniphila]